MRLTQEAQVMPSTPTESSIGRGALTAPPSAMAGLLTYSPGVYQQASPAPPMVRARTEPGCGRMRASGPPASWRRRHDHVHAGVVAELQADLAAIHQLGQEAALAGRQADPDAALPVSRAARRRPRR